MSSSSAAPRVVSLAHVKASVAGTHAPPAAPKRIAWPGGDISSNKEQAVRDFLARKRSRGESLTEDQLTLLRTHGPGDPAILSEAEAVARGAGDGGVAPPRSPRGAAYAGGRKVIRLIGRGGGRGGGRGAVGGGARRGGGGGAGGVAAAALAGHKKRAGGAANGGAAGRGGNKRGRGAGGGGGAGAAPHLGSLGAKLSLSLDAIVAHAKRKA